MWGSLVPPLPFLALSLWLEGPVVIEAALRGIGWQTILVLAYLAFGATILGYGLWSRLLSLRVASDSFHTRVRKAHTSVPLVLPP